jgi:photosystem II stability/assembly factor-like uncharacterized protein
MQSKAWLMLPMLACAAMAQDENKTDAPEVLAPIKFDDAWVSQMQWRSIGPASMGGRIVDLEVLPDDPFTFYLATASGGLFKTTNNGTTFTPVFEKQSAVSIGDVAVSRSDPKIIWVGTGEHNARNSVSWGDGVYKSTDAGKTWTNMGLEKSFQIGRIAIHPKNPDIVYVGVLGRLWGPNEERGLYKTTDGGKTWKKVLHVDDKTGCVEVKMHSTNPDTLIVAMYERERDGFDSNDPAKRWGPGSGIYKTTDGGVNWKKLKKGLPTRPLGRVGISYYEKNPDIVYAIIETDKIGTGPAAAFMGINGGNRVKEAIIQGVSKDGPSAKAGIKAGDLILQMGEKEVKSYNDLIVAIRAHKPKDKVKVKLKRDEEELELELTFAKRGGDTNRPFTSYLGGQRANAMKEQGGVGNETGGIYRSEDGGDSWKRINSLNPRPFYYSQIFVDPSDDKFIYVMGIQFHYSTDRGKTFKAGARGVHPDHHALWVNPRDGRHLILGCDGGLYITHDRGTTWDFHNVMDIGQFYDVGVDTRAPYWVYGGLQDNGSWGAPNRKRGTRGTLNSDWLRIGGGDGFLCRADPDDPYTVYCEMQGGRIWRVNMKTGARFTLRPPGKDLKFNWKTPFVLSPHNSRIFFSAGNYVFRSLNRGADLQPISPKLGLTDRGTATALAESPRRSGVLWAGTDDGALWLTRDGGREWVNLIEKVGLPKPFHVACIEPSRFAEGRAYVAFDGHRSNNDAPHIFMTEDFGMTWTSLVANLPIGSTRCLREDVTNENLLYCGTEFGVFASVDRGGHWIHVKNNLPTVAVHEIAVHPTAGEIVAGTHGRSAWILEVTPLRQFTQKVAAAKAHLFQPREGVLWAGALGFSRSGHRNFAGTNPAFGSRIFYYLGADAMNVLLEIRDVRGRAIRRLPVKKSKGLHAARWDLRAAAGRPAARPTPPDGKSAGPTNRKAPALNRPGASAAPGTYIISLKVDGKEFVQEIKITSDPDFPTAMLQEELEIETAKQRQEVIE